MKWGVAASGGALFKWRHGEQRKGGLGLASVWGQEKKGEGGCVAVGSAGRSATAPGQWARAVALLC
jgi:hypothetical protein